MRDLQYPDDARKVIDSLHAGLCYDATIAVLGIGSSKVPLAAEGPDFSVPIRLGGRQEDEAVRRDAPGLLSRFALISMVSRFEWHAQLLLLQRRVLEELKGPGKKMTPEAMWRILKRVAGEARRGPVVMCSQLIVEKPSEALLGRMKWLEGIYKVRNCLAHRLGKVQMVDVKPPEKALDETKDDDTLKAIWVRPKATFQGKDVTKSLQQVGGPGELNVHFEEYARRWKIGDQIELTPVECQGIAMSLSLLGNQLLADFEREMNTVLGIRVGT